MENASKALLIAAAVLIVIIIIAVGMKIYSSTTDAQKIGINTGKTINDKTGEATDLAIEQITGGNRKWVQNGETLSSGKTTVQIGDYVDYDCYSGVKAIDRKYKSPASKNGNSDQEFEVTEQDKIRKWRVFGIDNEGKLLIINADPIQTKAKTKYKLAGKNGFTYGIEELKHISSIYGHGLGAQGAQSITIEQVDKINKWTSSNSNVSYIRYFKSSEDGKIYREDGKGGKYNTFWYYENNDPKTGWKQLNNGETSPEITRNTWYNYTTYTNSKETKMLNCQSDGTTLFEFWIASYNFLYFEDELYYSIRAHNGNIVGGSNLFKSSGSEITHESFIRPIVTLLANVKLESNGDNNWKIK